jgi:N-acetylmuramoyl-L-alanine amidase
VSVRVERRRLFQWMLLPAAQALAPVAWSQPARVASTRLWPAQEYTRMIVESSAPLAYNVQVLREPERFVLDIAGVDASSEILELPSRVQSTDPFVQSIRVGRSIR